VNWAAQLAAVEIGGWQGAHVLVGTQKGRDIEEPPAPTCTRSVSEGEIVRIVRRPKPGHAVLRGLESGGWSGSPGAAIPDESELNEV